MSNLHHFIWPEVSTTDAAKAVAFYSALFGWTDMPVMEGGYHIFQIGGKDVGGLYQLMPEQIARGVKPHWLNYVAVESSDAAASKAKGLGGTVLNEPFDVPGVGRMAVIQDPTGATFCLWQDAGYQGEPATGLGTHCWTELASTDRSSALAFYQAMFGWVRNEGEPKDGFDYAELSFGGSQPQPLIGAYQIGPEMGPMPSQWMNYFEVADCDGMAAKAQGLGGSLFMPPTDIPDVGRFCVISDPFGASFAAVKLLPR
ncbi:MAG TPA: VOC family protein [Holophagaceae bacterium]|jgi:predicted enzyme related to lactoylglutathione lyase|nr:VOC family protein [Holophagaceae bacterium]